MTIILGKRRGGWPVALFWLGAMLAQQLVVPGAAASESGPRPLQSPDRPCSAIALVLSLDSSTSITNEEFDFEKLGFGTALRDPTVQRALFSSGPIKVATLFWGDPSLQARTTGWHLLTTPADAMRMAEEIELTPRLLHGDTGIGPGLEAALALLSRPEACAQRRLVNIIGDGREVILPFHKPAGVSLAVARHAAESMGVTVNGLAIVSDDPGLLEYYRKRVITGPDCFTMDVSGVANFAAAIRRKIMRETEAQIAALH